MIFSTKYLKISKMSEQIIETMHCLYGNRALVESRGLVASGKELVEIVKEKGLENELMDMARFVGQEVHIAYYVQQSGNILQLTNWSIATSVAHLLEVKEKTAEEKREEAEKRAIATASVITLDESLKIKTGEDEDEDMDCEEPTD